MVISSVAARRQTDRHVHLAEPSGTVDSVKKEEGVGFVSGAQNQPMELSRAQPDFLTLEQLQEEDSDTDYSSEEEDESLLILKDIVGEFVGKDEATAEATRREAPAAAVTSATLARASVEDSDIAHLASALKSQSLQTWFPEVDLLQRGATNPSAQPAATQLEQQQPMNENYDDCDGPDSAQAHSEAQVEAQKKSHAEPESQAAQAQAQASQIPSTVHKTGLAAEDELAEQQNGLGAEDEDALFDADVDRQNEAYVAENCRGAGKVPSDALLSCPACFCTVAYDTRQVSTDPEVYHAAVARNCKVDAHGRRGKDTERVVRCDECGTSLGVFRDDSPAAAAYEFTHTIPSAI